MMLSRKVVGMTEQYPWQKTEPPDDFLRAQHSAFTQGSPAITSFLRTLKPENYAPIIISFLLMPDQAPPHMTALLKRCAQTLSRKALAHIPEGKKWLYFLNMLLYTLGTNESSDEKENQLKNQIQNILRETFGEKGILPIALLPEKREFKLPSLRRHTSIQDRFAGKEALRTCTSGSKLMEIHQEDETGFEDNEIGLLQHYRQEFYKSVQKEQEEGVGKPYSEIKHSLLVPSKNAMIDTCYYSPRGNAETKRKLVIFCSGNSGSSELYSPQTVYGLLENGLNVITFNYRGFGSSSKTAVDDKSITRDTQAMIDHAIRNLGYHPNDIVMWGFSLGSLPAIRVACGEYHVSPEPGVSAVLHKHSGSSKKTQSLEPNGHTLGGLITYGAITTTEGVILSKYHEDDGENKGPSFGVKAMAKVAQSVAGFNSVASIRRVTIPTLLIKGKKDDLSPHTDVLYAARRNSSVPECALLQVEAGHLHHHPIFEAKEIKDYLRS